MSAGETYRLTTPCLESLPVGSQVCIDDLGDDVLAELALEALKVERRVHGLHESLHLRALVLVEP